MAQDDIQGQVVDPSGNPVSGAIVELTRSFESNPVEKQTVLRTTTDSNGNYIFEFHPDGDGTTQDYHVSCYNHDGTAYVNSFNNPGVTADLPSNVIPDSGVARWTFDNNDTNSGTAIDVWNGNDGTINGATSGVSGANQTYTTNEAYSFDGADDLVSTPNNLIPESGYSIAAWFRTSTDASGGINEYLWRFRGDTDSVVGQIGSATNTQNLAAFDGSGFVDTGVAIDDNTWRHAVETYDGSTMKIYVDGSEVLSTSASKTDRGESNNYLGNAGPGTAPWDGEIDDPRCYDKVLSSTEVSDLYNTGSI